MINYPIDLVFPYVNSTSQEWQKTYVDFCRNNGYEERVNNFHSERYRDWGLLRYVFRGIENNLKFVRKVFLILQGPDQIPEWLDQTSVEIIYHKDFIPEEYLPTYNSTTIEMFLDKIPGLSEHFIYANDDIYAMRPMNADDFFADDGKVKIGFRERSLTDFRLQFNVVCCNCFNQVQLALKGKDTTPVYLTPFHELMPMIKSHVSKVKEILGNKIEKNITPFRHAKNHNQYIYPYYEFFTGNATMPSRTYAYVNMEDNVKSVTDIILARNAHSLVLNDNEKTDLELWGDGAPVRSAFEGTMFKMSRFEKHPRVTIAIPMYNAQDYIIDCLNSIPARKDLEILVMDDCCTDESNKRAVSVVSRFAKYGIFRMQKNSGVATCRNVMIDIANGDYIFFLDADDKIDAEAFNRVVDNELTDQDILTPKYIRNDGFSGYPTILRGCFVKKSYIGNVRHDPNRRCFEDVDFKRRLKEERNGLNEVQSNEIVYLYNMPLVGSLTWQHYKEMGNPAYSKGTDEWERWFKGRPR